MAEKFNVELDIHCQNSVIEFYTGIGQYEKGKEIFESLKNKGFLPNSASYTILIKGLKKLRTDSVEQAESLLEQYKDHNEQDIIFYNSMLDFFLSQQQY